LTAILDLARTGRLFREVAEALPLLGAEAVILFAPPLAEHVLAMAEHVLAMAEHVLAMAEHVARLSSGGLPRRRFPRPRT